MLLLRARVAARSLAVAPNGSAVAPLSRGEVVRRVLSILDEARVPAQPLLVAAAAVAACAAGAAPDGARSAGLGTDL